MHAPSSATAISVGAESIRNMVPKDRPTAQAATTSCLGRGARRRTMPNRKPAVMDTAPGGQKDRTGEIGAVQVLGKRHRGRVEQAEERPGEGVDHEQHAHRRGGGEQALRGRGRRRGNGGGALGQRALRCGRALSRRVADGFGSIGSADDIGGAPAASPLRPAGIRLGALAEHRSTTPTAKATPPHTCPPPARWRQRAR